jgi:hypothetical protein
LKNVSLSSSCFFNDFLHSFEKSFESESGCSSHPFLGDFGHVLLQPEECISFFLMLFHHDYPHVLRRALNQKAVAPLIPFKCFSSHFEKSSESVALYMKFGFF